MKKLIVGLTLLSSFSALAATSGSISISGTVEPVLELSLDSSSFTTLDILAGGDHLVATATEKSNDSDGYKIYAHSDNGSELRRNGTSTTYKTSYTLKYDGGSAVTLGVGAANKVEVKDSGALTGLTTDTSQVVVDVTAYASAPDGTYSDTIVLNIEAN